MSRGEGEKKQKIYHKTLMKRLREISTSIFQRNYDIIVTATPTFNKVKAKQISKGPRDNLDD